MGSAWAGSAVMSAHVAARGSFPGLLELALIAADPSDLDVLAEVLHDTSCDRSACAGFDTCGDARGGRFRRWAIELQAAVARRHDASYDYRLYQAGQPATTPGLPRPRSGGGGHPRHPSDHLIASLRAHTLTGGTGGTA